MALVQFWKQNLFHDVFHGHVLLHMRYFAPIVIQKIDHRLHYHLLDVISLPEKYKNNNNNNTFREGQHTFLILEYHSFQGVESGIELPRIRADQIREADQVLMVVSKYLRPIPGRFMEDILLPRDTWAGLQLHGFNEQL